MSYCGNCEDCAPKPEHPPKVVLADQLNKDLERVTQAINDLSEIRPEARELARSGHPAKKAVGKAAVEHIQSEIRRLSAERRELKARLPDAVE